jgi:hypothetical protein
MDETGCFSALSDYGDYSYLWGYCARGFRESFLGFGKEYILGKLSQGREEYNGPETYEYVKRLIWYLPKEKRGAELKLLNLYNKLHNEGDYYEWYFHSGTEVDTDSETMHFSHSQQAEMFVDRIVPRLKKQIRIDLLTEGKTEMATLV